MAKILAFSGSGRKGSFNQMLAVEAANIAREAGAEVTVVNLADFNLPLFDQDLEAEGFPEGALALKKLLQSHDGLVIASPEYNSAFSPLLKNAIDWASRISEEGEAPLSAYQGKQAVILSTSPGGLGGMRGLVFLRLLLGNIGVDVLPGQLALGNAMALFDEQGQIADQTQRKSLAAVVEPLVERLDKLAR